MRSANRNLYCDGTFKSNPNLFYQLYTIHDIYKTTLIPVVYCLLSSKTTMIYTELFSVNLNGTRRRPPMFAHSIWNCYTSVIEGIPLANNCVEG
ncbi:hypothetical protein HZS_2784 [Henneguya salminicola]|nr:hypothetical protein HZS_2784 [Henneguya salminicola]